MAYSYKNKIIIRVLFILCVFITLNLILTTGYAETIQQTKEATTPFVEDNANLLSSTTKRKVTKLNEDQTSHLVILTVDKLNGQNITDVAKQKGEQHGVTAIKQNGMILVIAVNDKQTFLLDYTGKHTQYNRDVKTLIDTLDEQSNNRESFIRFNLELIFVLSLLVLLIFLFTIS